MRQASVCVVSDPLVAPRIAAPIVLSIPRIGPLVLVAVPWIGWRIILAVEISHRPGVNESHRIILLPSLNPPHSQLAKDHNHHLFLDIS